MDEIPAFPCGEYDGMSLRDWFAGHAMAGWLANTRCGPLIDTELADQAEGFYAIADAMLAARTPPTQSKE